MRTLLALPGVALSVGATAALLAGCGTLRQAQYDMQPPTVAPPGALPQNVRRASSAYSVLYRFNGGVNGGEPVGPLVDVDGTLYGTASQGGTGPCLHGCGTVYSIGPNGGMNLLFSFSAGNGAQPNSGLIDVKGTLYGTTPKGGADQSGTVYGITTSGAETTLYSFESRDRKGQPDGKDPNGRLINVKGTLYGTTAYGGTENTRHSIGWGVVYRITTSGEEKVLYRFKGGSDGMHPNALVYIKGMVYGTTATGGMGCSSFGTGDKGCGTFYSLSPSGVHKVLYEFGGGSDGAVPQGRLIQVDGTLYGTTSFGGTGRGTVYSISTSGAEQVVYRFAGGSDGSSPLGGLLDVNGTLYGTTSEGGDSSASCSDGCGTIYSVTTSGTENVLYRFAAGRAGFDPCAALTNVHGSLYGTASRGGETKKRPQICCGTVFRFTP